MYCSLTLLVVSNVVLQAFLGPFLRSILNPLNRVFFYGLLALLGLFNNILKLNSLLYTCFLTEGQSSALIHHLDMENGHLDMENGPFFLVRTFSHTFPSTEPPPSPRHTGSGQRAAGPLPPCKINFLQIKIFVLQYFTPQKLNKKINYTLQVLDSSSGINSRLSSILNYMVKIQLEMTDQGCDFGQGKILVRFHQAVVEI